MGLIFKSICLIAFLVCLGGCGQDSIDSPGAGPVNNEGGEAMGEKDDRIRRIVKLSLEHGYPIDVVKVDGHKRFTPTKGADGAECHVTESRNILAGTDSIKAGQAIHLYPYTDLKEIVVVSRDDGNWLPVSSIDEIKSRIEENKR